MTVRERIEQHERLTLAQGARCAGNSTGRERDEEPCPYRTCFMRDRDRIIHCKAFRRLKHKTQVFVSPEKDHYRTRLTHTLEVSQIARTISRGLGLNEDLTEAIALGHDLGHTPFGHAGERALTQASGVEFHHNRQSLRVVSRLEKFGAGLNLSREVLDGILCHTGPVEAATLEGRVVAVSDRIAYINHDIDDAVRAGVMCEEDIPASIAKLLGAGHGARINTLVGAVMEYGLARGEIGMDAGTAEKMNELREFMFDAVYRNPIAKGEEQKGVDILKSLYEYYVEDINRLTAEYRMIWESDGPETAVCDYIAGMTDRFAVAAYQDIFIPKGWNK